MALEVSLPTLLAQLGISQFNKSQLGVTEPTPNSARNHYAALDAAAEQRVKEIAPDAPELLIGRKEYTPVAGTKLDSLALLLVIKSYLERW